MRAAAGLLCLALSTTTGCAGRQWPAERVEMERAVLERVNEERAAGSACPSGPREAAPPLAWNEELAWAARLHAEDMAQRRYFSHDSQDGRTAFERMQGAGYDGDPRAENIAAGAPDVETVMTGWMTSDGHCLNIMEPSLGELGVGFVEDAASEWTFYWVQNFGSR